MFGKMNRQDVTKTENPVELAAKIIDSGTADEATNRITQRLTALSDAMSIVESFSHVVTVRTDAGLVCFDTSAPRTGAPCLAAVRQWSAEPVNTIVYTHGHIDHVGGSAAFAADAAERGDDTPTVLAHEACRARFERYDATNGYNLAINGRQFGGTPNASMKAVAEGRRFLPADALWPTREVADRVDVDFAGTTVEIHHAKGETDDHLWSWIPSQKALLVGDLVTWVFPNCGNPQKVQRFPLEWAQALREMQALDAEWLIGAHGLPVHGAERVQRILDDLATALESLVHATVEMMNAGEPLDAIVNAVSLPPEHLDRPWMKPVYDEPEFVVRNIWRLYGGWWDLNPAHLKPASEAELGAEVAALAGGTDRLVARAGELAAAGEFRLACHVIEFAAAAEPTSAAVHGARAEIYAARRDAEAGLMSRGIFTAAENVSRAHLPE